MTEMKRPDETDPNSRDSLADNPLLDRPRDDANSADQPNSTGAVSEGHAFNPPISGPRLTPHHLRSLPRRRWRAPLFLFVVTCLSTFWAGAMSWQPFVFGSSIGFRREVLRHWDQGVTYMACVLAILLAHELGHFFATLYYRIPASYPTFIPFPGSPIGTMGAVIAMDGSRANRREIFDVGIAGPLAGLVVAIPILWIGVSQLDLSGVAYGNERYDCPLLIEWFATWLHPNQARLAEVRSSQLNAFFMAGWVGLLITGLNMMPVSQLDGGHVIYALFGRRAHWIARGFIFGAILFVVFAEAMLWSPMIVLVVLMGTDHPPTADDTARLGPVRTALGFASLAIPILCFPVYGVAIEMY